MIVEVALTPHALRPEQLSGSTVVFDVLRATTTMSAALAAGVVGIRIFDSLDAARTAAAARPAALLCGERGCLPPPGFDLGNSPGAFNRDLHAGRTLFMSTTNGTKAIVAAREAKLLVVGAVVNASAVARVLADAGHDVLLLCAGTDGEPAMEDLLGAGAVITGLRSLTTVELASDVARVAERLFLGCRDHLHTAMTDATGARNVIAAGLAADIAYAARLDVMQVVGVVHDTPLRVVASHPAAKE